MWTNTGTLYYRAPEMLSGGYREGVDIWSIGVLLYRLICGKTPFESEYHSQTIKNIREKTVEFPQQFEQYSPELKSFLVKIMERNVDDRPNAQGCLKNRWFASLIQRSPNRKSARLLDENNAVASEPKKRKFKVRAGLSLDVVLDQFLENCSQEPLKESVRPYVCKGNGQEWYCIDSEWKIL